MIRSAAALGFFAAVCVCACDGSFRFDESGGTDASGADAAADGATAVACKDDKGCPLASLHCDVPSGACFACVIDANCTTPGLPRCDSALNRCVECGSNQDCGSNAVCEPSTHKCQHTCMQPIDCPASTPECNSNTGICYRCDDSSSDCPPPLRCEKQSGRCVECLSPADCPAAKPYCDVTISKCVGCLDASDCPSPTPVCDPATGTCVAP